MSWHRYGVWRTREPASGDGRSGCPDGQTTGFQVGLFQCLRLVGESSERQSSGFCGWVRWRKLEEHHLRSCMDDMAQFGSTTLLYTSLNCEQQQKHVDTTHSHHTHTNHPTAGTASRSHQSHQPSSTYLPAPVPPCPIASLQL